jgi:hypothetical protein
METYLHLKLPLRIINLIKKPCIAFPDECRGDIRMSQFLFQYRCFRLSMKKRGEKSSWVIQPFSLTKKSFIMYLIYSRIEVAADARRGGRSCGCPPQVLHNKADVVRSIRLKGKFGRNFLWKTNGKREKEKDL